MVEINHFMLEKNININLQTKVRRYLEYANEQQKNRIKFVEGIIENLSKPIRDELLMNIYEKEILKFHHLSQNFSLNFLKELAVELKEIYYAGGDIILNQKNKKEFESNLYLVDKGFAEIFVQNGNNTSILRILKV